MTSSAVYEQLARIATGELGDVVLQARAQTV